MIRYKIEGGQIREQDCRGTMMENCADVSMLVNGIYSMMAKTQPAAARMFKWMLQTGLSDNSGPIWQPEDYDGISIVTRRPRDEHVDRPAENTRSGRGIDEEGKKNDRR